MSRVAFFRVFYGTFLGFPGSWVFLFALFGLTKEVFWGELSVIVAGGFLGKSPLIFPLSGGHFCSQNQKIS